MPATPDPVMTDDDLLDLLASEEGFESGWDLTEAVVLDSVQPGICRTCEATTGSCEPDARDNWCHSCGDNAVASVGTLSGLV